MESTGPWLQARWRALSAVLEEVSPQWRMWARDALTSSEVGRELVATIGWAAGQGPSRGYDASQSSGDREARGQWFTPGPIADLVARVAEPGDVASWPSPVVLDPACGAGSLLVAIARERAAAGWGTAEIVASVEGWDLDPRAAWAARAALVQWAAQRGGDVVPGGVRIYGGVDALAPVGRPGELLARVGPFERGVGAVVTNPPYLEAKRMARVDSGLRERLRAWFPELRGAFDLYLAFCLRALHQLDEGGRAVLLVPNKVLQGRYAASFRRRIAEGTPALVDLVDLASLRPRPFPGTGVYPVVLHLGRTAAPRARVHRVDEPADLAVPRAEWAQIPHRDLRLVGGEHPLFVPLRTWRALAPLFALPRLGTAADLRSTCSFHARGLREQFVTPSRPDAPDTYPYLGGVSRSRRLEVGPFEVRWDGWWIRYDQQVLKGVHRNPLPDLDRTFSRPKAIFCQHGLRMRAAADPEGRWVTKDVYPVAVPRPPWSLHTLVGVLDSTVFTALYNTVYRGIVCGGETYHYLPAFLRTIPVPPPDHPALAGVDDLVRGLHDDPSTEAWDEVDRRVATAYGVSEADRQLMITVHLVRVGARAPTGRLTGADRSRRRGAPATRGTGTR